MDAHFCELCGCVCVACVQLADGCDSCELKHPDLLQDYEVDASLKKGLFV